MSNADIFSSLAEDMVKGHKEKVRWWADFRAEAAKENKERAVEVSRMLGEFAKEDLVTRREVTQLLKSFIKEDKKKAAKVSRMLGEFVKEDPVRRSKVMNLLEEFKTEDAPRMVAITQLLQDFSEEDKERAAEVSRLLKEFSGESAERATAWRNLVNYVELKKRAIYGAPPMVEAAPPPVKLPEVEEKVSREKANPGEKVRLEEEILSLINEHPEGIKLTTIAEKTGVARIKVGNVTRMLVDEGKIMKESLFYFPV